MHSPLQIYCDFSGYTDMAIGLGRVFGLQLPENFDAPYLARSLTEFWRRWHITLSSWLRDYVYIALGGSRHGRRRTYASLLATMLLGGLWHGAAWTFVAWGAFHGALLAAERALSLRRVDRGGGAARGSDLLRTLVTFHLVCLGWVLFRAPDFDTAGLYLGRMFTAWGPLSDADVAGLRWAAALLGLVGIQALGRSGRALPEIWNGFPPAARGFALASGVLLVLALRVDEVAFIYFQF